MIVLFRFVDFVATLSQATILFVILNSLCHTLRVKCGKWLLPVLLVAFAYLWTWFISNTTFKIIVQVILIVAFAVVFYKDSLFNVISATLMGLMFPGACESLSLTVVGLFTDTVTVDISGNVFASLPAYLTCITINIIAALLLHFLLANFRYPLRKNDFVIVLLFEVVIFLFYNNSTAHFLVGEYNETLDLIVLLLSIAFILLFLYMKNNYYLREQEQRDKMQIAQLQQQFVYYQEKMKDEERVRSIYHDLKNHLLIMESRQNTEETRQMAETLRSQIADYEDYVHTGNEFLDIILKDKSAKAREKQIDFSALVDFKGMDFIEPLDISTIFGNAIDNAMEASERLPEDQRLITVKAERVRDMLIITVENNTLPGTQPAEGTTKKDRFVHGFGIPNIKKAVEKYDGQCSFRQEDGTYLLKILIPIP